MPRRCLLSAALAALGWSLAAGVAVDGKHRQGQASLVAADPPAAAGAAAGAGAAPNMADVLDSAPALVYNDTVQSGEVARQALEDSEKEFAKINRLLDKQISEQGVKVMATKMHLQQAVACVEESTAHIADIKHREAAARAELAKLHAEAGIGAAAPPPPATSTAAPSNKTAASTTAAATVAAPAVGGGAKPAGAVSPAGAALLAMAKPGSSVAFVEVREQESAWAAQRSLRGGSGSGSGSGSGAGSNEAAARTHASEVVSSLETAWRRQATEEQGRPVVVLSNRAGGRGGAAAFVGHGRVVGGGKGAAAGTPDGGSIGGYSRLENVRAFLTSAAANAANSRLSLPSIGGLSPFLMMGDGGGGGGDGGGGRVGGRGGAGSGGDMGGAIAGIGGGGFPAAGGSGGGVVGGMGDPTSALKEALAKAVARVETWLSAVTAQSQATRNRRDECTVHVDELTSLLQSQRTFLALLRTRKEYEGKVFQAQQANDRSLAEFAEQEQGVLLADLVRFNRKWNVQRTATPELQLPPLSLPDWEEYSNTVALAAEPAAGAGGAGGAGAAAAAAFAGRGTAVSVAVALGRGPPLPGRKGPRTADPEPEVANTTAAATTAAPTEAAPATTNPAESTPAPPATTTRAPAAPTTAADAPTPPVVTTSGAPAESTAVLDDTTSAEPKLEPVAVADKPLVSNDAPPPSSNGTRPTLVISGQVKAWADINQTAEGSAEYSAFDISNNVFGAN